MTATNQFLPFANGGGANTLSPSVYATLTSLLANGYQSGLASSVQMNTTWRQSSEMAAMIGQFIADIGLVNANDDNNLSALETNFITAVRLCLTAKAEAWTAAQYGAFVPVQPVAAAGTLTLNFALGNNFVIGAGAGVTNAINANFILGNPTNVQPGQSGIITMVQDATGSRTISSRGSLWKGLAGGRPNLTASVANCVDQFPYIVNYDGNITMYPTAGNIS